MKKVFTTQLGDVFTINHASTSFAGYGHQRVTVEIQCNGKTKEFSKTTTQIELIDESKELEGQQRYEALFEATGLEYDTAFAERIADLAN